MRVRLIELVRAAWIAIQQKLLRQYQFMGDTDQLLRLLSFFDTRGSVSPLETKRFLLANALCASAAISTYDQCVEAMQNSPQVCWNNTKSQVTTWFSQGKCK